MLKYAQLIGTKGVNLRDDSTALQEGEVAYAKNMYPAQPGILSLRPAMQFERKLIEVGQPNNADQVLGDYASMFGINGSFTAEPVVPIDFEFARLGGEFVVVYVDPSTGQGYLDVLPKAVGDQARTNLGEITQRPTLVVWNNLVYCFTGNDSGWVVARDLSVPRGFTIQPFAFTNETAAFPQLCAVVRNRFWFGQFGGEHQNMLWFSEEGNPTKVTGSGDHFNPVNGYNVTLGQGEILTALASLATSAAGSPAQTALFAWTRNSTYQIQGAPGTDASVLDGSPPEGDMQVVKLNTVAGCVSAATVVQTPYGTLWAGDDDVWLMDYGSLPRRVGTKLRPAFLESPNSLKWKWHAAYDNGFYKLAIFEPGQGPTQYSPCKHQWWLDLRKGAPQGADDAMWWGPMRYSNSNAGPQGSGVHCMRTDPATGQLVGMATYRISSSLISDGSDRFKGVSIVSFNGGSSRDTAAPQGNYVPVARSTQYYQGNLVCPDPANPTIRYRAVSDGVTAAGAVAAVAPQYTDGGVVWYAEVTDSIATAYPSFEPNSFQSDFSPLLRSREATMGSAVNDKLIDAIELGYWTSQPLQLQVTRLTDYASDITTTLPASIHSNLQFGLAPHSRIGSARIGRVWQSKLLAPAVSDRLIALTLALEFRTVPGIYMPHFADSNAASGYDTVNYLAVFENLTDVLFQVPLTTGWYNDVGSGGLAALATALNAAFAANSLSGLVLAQVPWGLWTLTNGTGRNLYFRYTPLLDPNGDDFTNLVLSAFGFADGGTGGSVLLNNGATWTAKDFAAPNNSPTFSFNQVQLRYRGFGRRPT